MSTEIDARFWLPDKSIPVNEKFLHILDVVEASPQAEKEWQGLSIVKQARSNVVFKTVDISSKSDLQRLVEPYQDDTLHITTGIACKCWRFSGIEPQRGAIRIQVESWGHEYANGRGRKWRVEGDASISLQTCGPYCAILKNESDLGVKKVNSCVEENLEHLTDLLFNVVESIKPKSMKIFTDAGMFLPFNAHLSYYQDPSQVLEDLQYIAEVWAEGLPSYNTPPLKQFDSLAFHVWRDKEIQVDLWNKLSASIHKVKSVSKETVERVLRLGRFDTYDMPVGITVLEYPYFFNAFLDRFYLEILDAVEF